MLVNYIYSETLIFFFHFAVEILLKNILIGWVCFLKILFYKREEL